MKYVYKIESVFMKIHFLSQNQYNQNFRARTKFSLNSSQKGEIRERISNPTAYSSDDIEQLNSGSLGIVYKVVLPWLPTLAVKTYKKNDKYRNADTEATVLERIPDYCTRTQKLVDVFPINGKNAVVSTFISGYDLGGKFDDISPELFDNILDELFMFEKSGMVFYDFSGANIKVNGDNPGFFDFECYKNQHCGKSAEDSWKDSNHMARNIFCPHITNVAAFEIRTVGKVLSYLERDDIKNGAERADVFTKKYLKSLSHFYERTSELYDNKIPDYKKVIEYEKTLSRLFKEPNSQIIEIEKQMMRLRELTTEKSFRNDPNLPHDDLLYQDENLYKRNLIQRFSSIEELLNDLRKSSEKDIVLYAEATKIYLDNMKRCWLGK